ncbi:hypothetical protein LCGC14_2101360 [marine sediment metagenome]|uniref:Uncharacterized protein n=1 Tax=marine sediment metagenome TaxID=412755 RepID=A0A0F9EA10_9ZZZZ
MQIAEQRLEAERKAKRKARHKTRVKARLKAKAFVKKVNELQGADSAVLLDASREPSWPLDDTDLACEAFELAYALADRVKDC